MFYMLTAQVDCANDGWDFFIPVMADTYGRTQFLDVLLLMGSFSMSRSPHYYSRFVVELTFFVRMRNCVQQLGLGVLPLHSIQYIMRKS